MSVLCIVLCALCLPFSVFGQETLKCHCKVIGNSCDFRSKYFHPTNRDLTENTALGKPAVSSSTMNAHFPEYGRFANSQGCLANNGNKSRVYLPYYENPAGANCIQTAANDLTPSWTVNLVSFYTVLEISIHTPVGLARRMMYAIIKVDHQFCLQITAEPQEVQFYTCLTTLTGQNVSISKAVPRNTPQLNDHTLSICEVEVWTCRDGYYGENCGLMCMDCKDGCDYYNGTCKACKLGYYNYDCARRCQCKDGCNFYTGECLTNACNYGFYNLPLCNFECGPCENNATCDSATGRCPTVCKPGWKGDGCMERCEPGKYGSDCLLDCGACKHAVCDPFGFCLYGCEDGWMGDKCMEGCSNGFYGPGCTLTCVNCKDGICAGNGICIYGCKLGYKGDKCTTGDFEEADALPD